MAGVRKFDEEQVCTQALEVFWPEGLSRHLDNAPCGGNQCAARLIYNGYGDKEELFNTRIRAVHCRIFQRRSPRTGYARHPRFAHSVFHVCDTLYRARFAGPRLSVHKNSH
jgi:hypothetical protein